MREKIVIIFLLMSFSLSVRAGDGEYSVSKIPADLLKNAHVIKSVLK
jgi:hypothetical protein